MRKLLSILVSVAFLSSALSQEFGFKAGVNFSGMSSDEEGVAVKTNIGYNFGIIMDYALAEKISLQPGLFYSLKGALNEDPVVDKNIKLNYFEVPVNIVFKTRGDELKFLAFTGPYFGYCFKGKSINKAGTISETYDINIGSDEREDDYKPVDFGFNIGVGAEMGKFIATIQYGIGLTDIRPLPDVNEKNRVIGISLAYIFR